jgi:cytochrome c oxidase cbb3-type subunit 4
MGTARGLITLILMVAFLALVAWLASSRNKHRYDAAAQLPLEDDAPNDWPNDRPNNRGGRS